MKQLDSLIESHLPRLRAFVRLRLGARLRSLESESDLVQSTCREMLRNPQSFREADEIGFGLLLFARAEQKIIERARYWRAQKRDPFRITSIPDDEDKGGQIFACYKSFLTPSQEAIGKEELLKVEAAFETLPKDYQEVILLSRIAGLSRIEISSRMKRSEASVRSLLSRALVRFSELLG